METIVKKHLYSSITSFIFNMNEEDRVKYRDLAVYKDLYDKLPSGNHTSLEKYQYIILLHSFLVPKINQIVSLCSTNKIRELSKRDIIEWFFSKNITLMEPFNS